MLLALVHRYIYIYTIHAVDDSTQAWGTSQLTIDYAYNGRFYMVLTRAETSFIVEELLLGKCKEVWNFLSYHVTRDHERSLGTEWDTGE